MIKKLINKINKRVKEKKGASLVIVLVSLSMLIVLGTVFSTLAYQSYKSSYGTLCRQQAKYTAKSVLDGVITKFQGDSGFRQKVGNAILNSLDSKEPDSEDINFGEITIDINGLHGYIPNSDPTLAGSIPVESNTNDCKLFASYVDSAKTKVRLTVSAIYRGFNSSLSAVLGITNQAALELSKIMSNTLYITSPIADMMYYASAFDDYQIDGDVYIDKPLKLDGEDPYKNIEAMANDGSNQLAGKGHTLGIDIEGRPIPLDSNQTIGGDTLYDYFINSGLIIPESERLKLSNKTFPKPNLGQNNQLSFIYDAYGSTYPLEDSTGKQTEIFSNGIRFIYDGHNENGRQNFKQETYYENNSTEIVIEGYDQRPFLYERDSNGKYGIEYEPDRNGDGNFILDAVKNPTYKRNEDGSIMTAKWCIEGQNEEGHWNGDPTGIFCRQGKDIGKTGNAERWATYKIYQCEYMKPIYKDGVIQVDNKGQILYEIHKSSDYGIGSNGVKSYYSDFIKDDGSTVRKVNFELYDRNGYCYQRFYDIDGNVVEDYPVYKIETKWILGEKWYSTNWTVSAAPPDGYERGVWYAEERFGYGMEVEPHIDNGAFNYFDFVDKAYIGDGKINTNNIIDQYDENGNLTRKFKRYPIQRFQRSRAKKYMTGIPLPKYRSESKPNEWTEVYLRSHYESGIDLSGKDVPIVINGKLKCNTDVLLGLYNRGVDGNGSDHEFIRNVNDQDRVVPVAFDTTGDIYTIPKYSCLRTSDDIYVNGNVRAENLMCGGTLYAVDLDNTDDNKRDGCKGNVVLEQMCPIKKIIGIPVSLTTYMEVAKNNEVKSGQAGYKKVDGIVADGFVVVVGGVANISEKAVIHGDIRAGRYKPDGTRWGFAGKAIENIPRSKYYGEDGKNPAASDLPDPIPGGIYGYNTQICEERWNKKNRYTLGSGDVVLQKTIVYGDIYATGDVYVNNGSLVYGNIYTPGNVYVTKGESPVVGAIGNMFDGRSRVLGSIYAGGTVALTGGSEVGKWDAKAGEDYYDSGVYCKNLYIRGRVNRYKNHDAITGDIYCQEDCTVLGRWTWLGVFYTRLGFHNGKIYVGGKFGGKDNMNADNIKLPKGGQYYFAGGTKNIGEYYVNNKTQNTTLKMCDMTSTNVSSKLLNSVIRDAIKNDLSAKVRKWSAPDKTSLSDGSKFYLDDKKEVTTSVNGDDTIIGVGGSTNYQEKTVVNGINHFVVRNNLKSISKIVLGDNDILTLDTTKQNLHICVSGNIQIGKNATIRVNGPNMANIYLNNNDNQKIEFGENCYVGEVVGVPVGVSDKYAGLNIISHKDIDMIINKDAKVITYNYIPKGALHFVLPTLTTRTEVRPQGSYVVNRVIGGTLDNMRYWAIKFATKKSPLIVDQDNNFGGGDAHTDDGLDFKEIVWEVISYE